MKLVLRALSHSRQRPCVVLLQQPLRKTVATVRIFDQHDLAAVGLHRKPAFLDIEFVVDQHHGGNVVALRQLRHQPVQPRLCAEARRARRHLGNVENIEALRAHRSGSGPPA